MLLEAVFKRGGYNNRYKYMKITLIGTGNIAFHLGKRFLEKKCRINQVVGRTEEKVTEFALLFDSEGITDFSKVKTDSDLYILAVNDDAIEVIAEKLAQKIDNQLVVHTSGAVSSTVLSRYFTCFGSLYPLQTFSRTSEPDFETLPIFINSSETPPQYPAPLSANFLKKSDILSQIAHYFIAKSICITRRKTSGVAHCGCFC
ncbi:MAG: NAD(P)-binding domain-containing protein [Saprospiraceae bacterium]|nr:NAD(P)-binding domain-containing protein [Saprospiraceae bacterium]